MTDAVQRAAPLDRPLPPVDRRYWDKDTAARPLIIRSIYCQKRGVWCYCKALGLTGGQVSVIAWIFRSALGRDEHGSVLVEAALVIPMLIVLIMCGIQFSLMLTDNVTLTLATQLGARNLSISRGSSTPFTTTQTQITNAAAGLITAKITTTVSIAGTACSTDASCSTLLSNNAGQPATVSTSYPCLIFVEGPIFGGLLSCTLTSSLSEMIQ